MGQIEAEGAGQGNVVRLQDARSKRSRAPLPLIVGAVAGVLAVAAAVVLFVQSQSAPATLQGPVAIVNTVAPPPVVPSVVPAPAVEPEPSGSLNAVRGAGGERGARRRGRRDRLARARRDRLRDPRERRGGGGRDGRAVERRHHGSPTSRGRRTMASKRRLRAAALAATLASVAVGRRRVRRPEAASSGRAHHRAQRHPRDPDPTAAARVDPQMHDLPQLTETALRPQYNVFRLLDRRALHLDGPARAVSFPLVNGRTVLVTARRRDRRAAAALPARGDHQRGGQGRLPQGPARHGERTTRRSSSGGQSFQGGHPLPRAGSVRPAVNASVRASQLSPGFRPGGGLMVTKGVRMVFRKADGPLSVQIPRPAADRPSWSRVGVIAAVGFIVGVAWPRLAGVRLGPSVPERRPRRLRRPHPATPDAPATTAAPAASPTVPASSP